MTMAVSELKSTPRRQWDIRGVEINGIFVPATPRVDNNTSPTRNRSRSMSRNPSLTRRSMSKNPSPTRRRFVSKAPSPTRRRSMSKAPSPTRRSTTRAASPRNRRQRSVSRNPSPQRGRRAGRSPSRQQQGPPSTSGRITESRPVNSSRRMSTGGSRSRALPSDSEGEAEPRYARKLDRSFSRRESSDNESFWGKSRASTGVRAGSSRRASGTQMQLLRSSFTNLDVSDTSTPVYYQKPKSVAAEEMHHNAGENGHEEVQAAGEEVKTIHEVTKLHTHLCYNSLYDVSSSADSPSSHVVSPSPESVQNSREAPPGDSPDFVRRSMSNALEEPVQGKLEDDGLREVMEPKLEFNSEMEVCDLWSQYTTEPERKGLHSVESVKDIEKEFSEVEIDLEVTQLPEGLKPQHNHRYPMDDMEESDFIRQSLDEEAARYFESECVILATFDSTVADDISVSTTTVSDDETPVWNDPGPPFRYPSEELSFVRTKAIVPLDDEGMLLPWLDWEPEVDLGRKEKAVVDFQGWKSASARKSVEWGRTLNRERGKDEGAVNVDEFLFERTRLQPRISHGRMLVCGGKR